MNVPMGEVRDIWRRLPHKDWQSVRHAFEHDGSRYGVGEDESRALSDAVTRLDSEHARFPDSPEQLERMLQGPLEDRSRPGVRARAAGEHPGRPPEETGWPEGRQRGCEPRGAAQGRTEGERQQAASEDQRYAGQESAVPASAEEGGRTGSASGQTRGTTRRSDITTLSALLKMNEDTVRVYDEAIGKVGDDQQIRSAFQQFRQDHQQHVDDIRDWLRRNGQRLRQASEEMQNLDRTALQDVSMARGRDEVLKAMTIGEAIDNSAYGEALQYDDVDESVKRILRQHLRTEHDHWRFVEQHSPLQVMATAGMAGTGGGGTGGGTSGGRGY